MTDFENECYALMLEVGDGDQETLREAASCLMNHHTAPELVNLVLGLSAMAHDYWTAAMTAELIKEGQP